MSQPRTSRLPDTGLPDTSAFLKITGSTAKILVTLYTNQLKIKATGNPTIDRAVVLDMQTADIRKKIAFTSSSALSQTSEAAAVSLSQLKNLSQETKAYAMSQEASLNDLKGKIEELHAKRDGLSKRYAELVDDQFKIMGSLLTGEKPTESEISNKVSELEKKRKNLADEIDQYSKQYRGVQSSLNTLYAQVYPQVPDKSKIPAPAQETGLIAPRQAG